MSALFRFAFVAALLATCLPAPVRAQSGATLTPDRRTFLVNKDLGAERWTISAGLATNDVESVISVTGNVFRSDGGPPSFVLCQIRRDSTGSLSDPASVFRLKCQGTDACQTNARECARDEWEPIADSVEIPASFFLPPSGLGRLAGTGSRSSDLAVLADRVVSWMRAMTGFPAEAVAQGSDRGATLSLDRLTYLVNKDVGGQRWSIGLNFVPVETESGGATNELLSVTGNVFFPDGSPPSFVFCTEREDSTGTLEDAASEFRFRCSGASACGTTAGACAENAWTPIADDVRLGASFFLPPGGLPPSSRSDPEIFVIGRTSDPPAIVTRDFTVPDADGLARVAGGATCPVGATCLADRIGSCTQVSGGVVEIADFGCGCEIPRVAPECITCGGGATGSCGASGGYAVGNAGRMARGICLPFSAQSDQCVLYAIGSSGSEDRTVDSCGGALDRPCPGERCCADDPRDGCDPATGVDCPGVCVASSSCDAGEAECGICAVVDPGGSSACNRNSDCRSSEYCSRATGLCGGGGTCATRPVACTQVFAPICGCDGSTYSNECEAAAAGMGVAAPGPCEVCGDGIRQPPEQCDGDALPAPSCADLGFAGPGPLLCGPDCRLAGTCTCGPIYVTCSCDESTGVCSSSVVIENGCSFSIQTQGDLSVEVEYPACGASGRRAFVEGGDFPASSTTTLSLPDLPIEEVCEGEGSWLVTLFDGSVGADVLRCDGSRPDGAVLLPAEGTFEPYFPGL